MNLKLNPMVRRNLRRRARSTCGRAQGKGHRYDWRQTLHKDHDDFSQAYVPHMDKEKGLLISLNVEADKV